MPSLNLVNHVLDVLAISRVARTCVLSVLTRSCACVPVFLASLLLSCLRAWLFRVLGVLEWLVCSTNYSLAIEK